MKTQNIQLEPAGPHFTSISAELLIRLNTYWVAVLALLFAGATLLGTTAASATTITVINTNDSGPGSLRQALSDANNGDTIDFDSSLKGETITLTSGQLLVNRSVTISGLGSDNLTVDGNANDRVFLINPANTVSISGLTITNGFTSSEGGGIRNDNATLTVSDCAISGNSANGGGGMYNNGTGPYGVAPATLTVSNSTLNGNSGNGIQNEGSFPNFTTLTVSNCTISGNEGGGIVNGSIFGYKTATITDSTVRDNGGSGIYNTAGTGSSFSGLTVTNSTVSGNSGGGIYNIASNGGGSVTLTVTNSTLSGNSASYGGGIANFGGVGTNGGGAGATITNSTLSGNSSNFGGGISNSGEDSAAVTITNSTLSGNSAPQGGGIGNSFATLTIGDTILKAGALGENIYNISGGTVSSLGYNLSSDNGGGYLTGPGDQINTDPVLGALQDNGGPTFTHALLPGSPAIDRGDPNFTPPPFYDQRGPAFPRVVNGRIDIGSFEVQAGKITLSASGRKVGGINTVRLAWSGATSANIDVYRNGPLIATVPNTGTYTDSTGDTGRARYTYRVCEAGSSTCSNDVTVRFRH